MNRVHDELSKYKQFITDALAVSNSGGNVRTVGETLSSFIAGATTLQGQLQEGLQAQLDTQQSTEFYQGFMERQRNLGIAVFFQRWTVKL